MRSGFMEIIMGGKTELDERLSVSAPWPLEWPKFPYFFFLGFFTCLGLPISTPP